MTWQHMENENEASVRMFGIHCSRRAHACISMASVSGRLGSAASLPVQAQFRLRVWVHQLCRLESMLMAATTLGLSDWPHCRQLRSMPGDKLGLNRDRLLTVSKHSFVLNGQRCSPDWKFLEAARELQFGFWCRAYFLLWKGFEYTACSSMSFL